MVGESRHTWPAGKVADSKSETQSALRLSCSAVSNIHIDGPNEALGTRIIGTVTSSPEPALRTVTVKEEPCPPDDTKSHFNPQRESLDERVTTKCVCAFVCGCMCACVCK